MNTPKATDFHIELAADLHKWRAFVAIGELGSLTRAALFLDSNQSLLSRQLNALERECGARLFNRTGRGVELSEVGARLFPQVKALLADAEKLDQEDSRRSEGTHRPCDAGLSALHRAAAGGPPVCAAAQSASGREPEGAGRFERPG